MATTPICNPHICRVLLGTMGVLWGTVATAGYWRFCGVLGVKGVLEVLWGTGGYGGTWE